MICKTVTVPMRLLSRVCCLVETNRLLYSFVIIVMMVMDSDVITSSDIHAFYAFYAFYALYHVDDMDLE